MEKAQREIEAAAREASLHEAKWDGKKKISFKGIVFNRRRR